MNINVLTNFKGWFCSSVAILNKTGKVTMDLEKMKCFAAEEGLNLKILQYSDVDLNKDYNGEFFIYTSSEDPGLLYKSYLEDVLYSLQMKGAILLPEWRYMRAHHNKTLMEMLREVVLAGIDTGIHSRFFGCNEELISRIDDIDFPCVYKAAEGAGSIGVALLRNKEQALAFIKKNNINQKDTIKQRAIKSLGKTRDPHHSNYRNKFVIQNFIPGLSGDYKVLVFGDKYYVLSRQNRDNDFRASGGGRLNYEPELPEGIFDFAKTIYDALNLPVLSLDIAHDGRRFYLIEFQCLHFGTATLEFSTHYYTFKDGAWVRHDESSILEKEYVNSIKMHILKNFNTK